MQSIGSLVSKKFNPSDTDKYVSQEFQKYAYTLAKELDDLPHKSLYMRLAKNTPRGLMESARGFVKDAINAKSKGRLYMWKLKQLKDSVKLRSSLKAMKNANV
ncbi:MAG: hypothetical protein ACD_19C00182G0090 [uncultured bacterium]|nr:MAG: hypothetical protein ACD_19C00182G0090 [uncultured bacterium]